MKALLAAGLVFLAVHAGAATPAKVKRGDLEIKVKVTGMVVAEGIFRIKATIDGRVESVPASTYAWHGADQPLALLAHKELAAMLDSKGAQRLDILEDRWQRVYRPTTARCPDTCFILKNFLKPKAWVKPESVMFEAATTLKLVARVRPEDVPWVHDGQEFIFWPVKDPKRILKGRVTKFLLDIQGEKATPGATFTLTMSPDRYIDPGAEWEGRITPLTKKDVLYMPTGALIRRGDGAYLPVRVSTGITTLGLTEITSGVEEKRDSIILDDAFAAGLVFLAARASTATPVQVKRGNLEIKVTGTVVPDGVFRIKSTIEGRIENVMTSTYAWREAGQPLALIAHRELAAMLDSNEMQNVDLRQDRWKSHYRPAAAHCPGTCFILKNFLKPKAWVKPESVMFEAAPTLSLAGQVRPEDAPWIHDGQEITFWPVKDPKRILRGRVTRFTRGIQGEPNASFTSILSPVRYFDPGTEWEGRISPLPKKAVLYVPTRALIRGGDGVYLPVRVSTGITAQGMTEITSGVEENRDALILDDGRPFGAERNKQGEEAPDKDIVPAPALKTVKEAPGKDIAPAPALKTPEEAPDRGDGPAPVEKPRKHATVIDSIDYGEDPYAEPP